MIPKINSYAINNRYSMQNSQANTLKTNTQAFGSKNDEVRGILNAIFRAPSKDKKAPIKIKLNAQGPKTPKTNPHGGNSFRKPKPKGKSTLS